MEISTNNSLLQNIIGRAGGISVKIFSLKIKPQCNCNSTFPNEFLNTLVTVTTSFGPVTGLLIAIQSDYIVIEDINNQYTCIPMNSIQAIEESP